MQSVQYGKEKGIKDRVFARYVMHHSTVLSVHVYEQMHSEFMLGRITAGRSSKSMLAIRVRQP